LKLCLLILNDSRTDFCAKVCKCAVPIKDLTSFNVSGIYVIQIKDIRSVIFIPAIRKKTGII